MPNPVTISTPTDVFPAGLASKFSIDERLGTLDNKYPDGSSDRLNLANIPRRYFTLSVPLNGAQWRALRDFYFAHEGKSFWFYVGRETVPPWTPDPTGAATDGRYAVVFDSPWSETIGLGRSSADFSLREVASG
jgi:hypothetical protein